MLQQVVVVSVVLHTCLAADLTYYIDEGKSPGTYLGDISADMHVMDGVSSDNRELITFSQMQQSTPEIAQLFRIAKKTGKLYTAQTLDAEAICTRNIECFKMLDVAIRRGKSFMKIFEVKVVINDINDHQPEFPSKKFDIEFSEESIKGARRSIPNAIDKDVGVKNSQISYHLKKNEDEPFTLFVSKNVDGTSKLSVTLEERLNREVKDSYLVQVIAKDGGSPAEQSVLNVQISVTDVNDNPPVFSQNVYNVSIKNEHDQVTPIAILSATDLDLGKNGKISYHYSSQTLDVAKEHFQLNSETGEIFLHKKFNVGQKLTYKLYIEATDGGSPPLNSIAMVLVNVISQQNNAPTIDVNFVSASTGNTATISEDIKVGSFIAYVKVTDHDFGPNGEVICNLHHEKFQLQSLGTKKYKIIIKKAVDREINDHHDIMISCQDRGYPPLRSESRFSIQVMDVNDEKPQFPKDTVKFWTYENQKPKSIIGSINATDPDSGAGGRLTYSLLSNNQNFLPFFITNSGLISTILPLDYEFQTTYKFQVVVKDHGVPPLNNTVNVVVEVKDVNDNAPYFTFPSVNPYSMDVVYYPRHTNNITVLKASDIDSRENAFLKYEILSGNNKQLFAIDHYSGLLSFTRVVIMDDAGSYELQLAVKDSGTPVLSATTNLFLMLTVSNKTSEMLTNSHKQGEDKIHMFLLIIIVLVSMAISIPVTAAISICFVRCKQRKPPPHRGGVNPSYKHEQRHLMCSTHQDMHWSNAPSNRNSDAEPVRDVPLTKARRGIYPGDKLDDVKKGTAPDIVYHVSPYFNLFYILLHLLIYKSFCFRYIYIFLFLKNNFQCVTMLVARGL